MDDGSSKDTKHDKRSICLDRFLQCYDIMPLSVLLP